MTNLASILKWRDITLPTKVHIVMYGCELDHKELWAPKNWCFWIVVLEKTLESPLDFEESKPVHPKGNIHWNIHWKDWCWSWNSNTVATWYEELTHLKRPWCWERLKAGGKGDAQGFSPTPQFKASILRRSAFFTVLLTSIHDHRKNHSFDCMDLCQQSDVSAS